MTRLRTATFLVCVVVPSILVGFGFGVREGARLGGMVEDPPRGVLAVRALTSLDDEKAMGARVVLERQVDRGLLSAHDLLDSPLRRFIWLVLGTESGIGHIEDYAVILAKYRRTNPSPFRGQYLTHQPEETPEGRALVDEGLKRHRETTHVINLMIERYASK